MHTVCPVSCVILAWCVSAMLAAADPAPATVGLQLQPHAPTAAWVRERIHGIFERRCFECHAGGQRKGGLRMDTWEQLLAGGHDEGALVTPYDTTGSTLMRSVRWQGDSDLNMPPKEQLPADEIADLERWIAMGAPFPGGEPPRIVAAPPKPPFFGRLHPVIVHLPLAALPLGLAAAVIALRRRGAWSHAAWMLAACGAAGAAAAVATGTVLAGGQDPDALEQHERLGWIAAAFAVIATGLLAAAVRHPRLAWAGAAAVLVATAVAGAAGHIGGELVHGKGWLW